MIVKRYVLGELATNTYLLIDEKTKEAAVIDPADEAELLRHEIESEGVTLRYILLTHGHRDHTLAAPRMHELYPEALVYIHEKDKGQVGIYHYTMEEQIGADLRFYRDGDTLELGSLTIEVIETPGHTGGCVCLKCGDTLFTGDTLFAGSMGRIDLPGAQPDKMMSSLRRLADLPGDYKVCPGHMGTSTLEQERRTNMYLKMLDA